MLYLVKDWRQQTGIVIPAGLDISPILALAKSDANEVRHTAIMALGACPRKESRDVLVYYLTNDGTVCYSVYQGEEWSLRKRFNQRFPKKNASVL